MTLAAIEAELSKKWAQAKNLHQEIDALTAEATRRRERGERAEPAPVRYLTRDEWAARHAAAQLEFTLEDR